jgi:nitrogen-specific signal transduction histidine kinase
VLKNNLSRLSASVRRALREAEERRARKDAEKSLLRAQRYEALALLASGLSHDLRNVLQPIAISASMLVEEGDERIRKIGVLLQTCTQRGLDIVTSMLSFARGARTTDVVKVAPLLEGLRTLLRGSVSKNTELVIKPPEADIEIEGNYTELQQCLLNLCLNALQAMPDGGRLTLAAKAHELDSGFFEDREMARPGSYLRIEVCDNGIGMSDEVKTNLFKAFFTTKKEGTGLGLLSCRRIIEDHLGYLRITSKPGEGTTFALFIPLRTVSDTATAEAEPPLGRGQRILLVSEGASVLSMMSNILSDNGYSVLPVQSGLAALQEIETNGLPDLVLMEAEMNLMTGVRAMAALIERSYRGPVIMIVESGKGASVADDLPPIRDLRLIEKPVSAKTLLRVVAEAAARASS